MSQTHELQIRVRYAETDAMGLLHHSNYFVYFEMGRTELLRSGGGNYRDMEARGLFVVVAKLSVQFKAPAHYDDLLTLRTTLVRASAAKLIHKYEVFRDRTLLCEGESTLACVDKQGQLQRIPEEFHYEAPAS